MTSATTKQTKTPQNAADDAAMTARSYHTHGPVKMYASNEKPASGSEALVTSNTCAAAAVIELRSPSARSTTARGDADDATSRCFDANTA